jgi:hypothetical protein
MSDSDDRSGDDAGFEAFAQEFERHRDALYEHICDFMEEEDLSESYMAQLLVDAMIRMRMTAYGMEVEKPSVAGLKIDLDRLRDELGTMLREAKKDAEEFIAGVKEARAEMEADERAAAEAGEGDDEEEDEGDNEEGEENEDEGKASKRK